MQDCPSFQLDLATPTNLFKYILNPHAGWEVFNPAKHVAWQT